MAGGVVILLCGVGLLIGYTSQQVAHAQKVKNAIDAAEDSSLDLPRQVELS